MRQEIAARGSIPFSRFMEIALYHPEGGYYRRLRDPFGKHGDFFTAAQLQPVFGRLVAQSIRQLGCDAVLDLGCGRGEMQPAMEGIVYKGIDIGDQWPDRFEGVIFANELFDALPVDVARLSAGCWRQLDVGLEKDRFVWVDGEPLGNGAREYASKLTSASALEEPITVEIPVRMETVMGNIARVLSRGYLLVIDYGYTNREIVRFRTGSLMSYRRHNASDDILAEPGARDITAHVPFDEMFSVASKAGLRKVRFERMSQWLLRVGESDQFASALGAADEREAQALRLQLKTLLFGMGESFHVALFEADPK